MDNNNNPYKKSFKTKREEYEEKLKQKSNNQEWIFGNYFGKPGGGAPLRDNQGNIVSSLKSISDMNIYRYEPQDFSKGNNNISVLNHKIYNQNNVISDPFSQSYDQINRLSPNQNITYQNNRTISAINQNRNNIMIDENKSNYLNQQNTNNNNVIIQQQMPYGYIIPYTNIVPYNQILPLQLYNNNNNVNNINNNYQNSRINYTAINPQSNYLSKTQNNLSNNNANNNIQNVKIVNNDDNKENNYLIVSNDNEINSKIQREKKLEEWRNEIKKQKEEKTKRDLEAKRASALEDIEEKRKYDEYLNYKKRQAAEHAKKIKKQPYLNRNINDNFLEMASNDLEQSKQTVSDIQNQYNANNNPLKGYDVPPELIKQQENFKNYINQQYETLGQSLEQSISNEIKKMATMLTSKYEPFPRKENPNNYINLKFENENAIRNEKKMQKLQDIIEERELLDFIIGNNDTFSPNKYKNYDLNKYNYKMSEQNPSFFGKNKASFEKKNVNLRSSSEFIYDDYDNLNKSKAKEYKSIFSHDEYEQEQQKQNDDFNYGGNKNNNLDNNYNVSNSQSRKFGRNRDNNINNAIDSIEVSQSLDNKTSFVPVNKDVDPRMIEEINKNINIRNEQQQPEYQPNINKNERQLPDKVEENIIKNLKIINKLNKDVILYDFDEKILQGYYNIEENNNNNMPQRINPVDEKKNEEGINMEKENEEQKQIENGEKIDTNNQVQPDIQKEENNNNINGEENNNIKGEENNNINGKENNNINGEENSNIKKDEGKKDAINEENHQNNDNNKFSEIGVQNILNNNQNQKNSNEATNIEHKVENKENKKNENSSPQVEIIENEQNAEKKNSYENSNEEKNKEKQQ